MAIHLNVAHMCYSTAYGQHCCTVGICALKFVSKQISPEGKFVCLIWASARDNPIYLSVFVCIRRRLSTIYMKSSKINLVVQNVGGGVRRRRRTPNSQT